MGDTIFAQATAAGRAGVAIIRVSGPAALTAAKSLAGELGPPRQAGLRRLRDPGTGETLDQALVVAYPAPGSFTGEDVVEFQVHGSPAVCRSLLAVLGGMEGLRVAEPGEFTRRALLNGRLDLPQVEGLGDLLAAETAAQQRQALRLMDGAISGLAAGWREELVRCLAHVEASIDFADEELPEDILRFVGGTLGSVRAAMRAELDGALIAERLRDGFEVALVGRPNVGKSTLLNALARREAALTSAVAGTTRDVLEVRMDLAGMPVTLLDMAGLRAGGGRVESLGIARARDRATRADVRVFLVNEPREVEGLGVSREAEDLLVLAKGDLRPRGDLPAVSGLTGQGVDQLLRSLTAVLEARVAGAGTASHRRQREAIALAVQRVEAAGAEMRAVEPRVELVAEELRAALRALDFLVGAVDVEAVLDVVFQSFCLGK
ncbi:tRNA uridine-5-carboxymethylaminomethyl(34) synthesis GTPase MnmE [Amaricoccus sp.]|uniref:tRNA uridine-5-carboxymethylaminomethyl(34) synthesis GTPase MnmE n=1 Tax=Amaricoccus sp. TaxID=1872485 RepID=UPI00262916C5|nr:tRNA uridine-5-carboxymethylaminomethyl(34) synthesis GTPase MnmE [Amaricoccus sp.]HRO12163.1 tRNA uridine-5-carboxymethylaminomethyl(34) synthesis GTPase MnmE [Amaricoccus sp.]